MEVCAFGIRKGAVGMVQEISGQASGSCLCNGQMAVRKIYDETGDGKQSFGAYGPGAGIFPELPEAGPLHTSAFAISRNSFSDKLVTLIIVPPVFMS